METKSNKQETSSQQQAQGFISDVKVYLNKDSDTIAHLAGELRIEMPVNFYKSILNLPFQKKEITEKTSSEKRIAYGAFTRPNVYLSKDKQYLIHRVFGAKISKHINYYKKIIESQSSLEAQPA